jgi:mannose-6-phosphate isomerase-like protein (cupin superfamily)
MTLHPMPGYLGFHVVRDGRALLEVGETATWLQPGDLALVPHGDGHVCAASHTSPRRTSSS